MAKATVGVFSDCSIFDGFSIERDMFEKNDIEVIGVADVAEFEARRREFDAFILSNPIVSRESIADMKRCRVICRHGQGVDNIDVEAATELGVIVCNVPGFNTDEVSDHALAFALMLGRNIPFYHHHVCAEHTLGFATEKPNVKIAEMTLGLLGFGRISRRFAQKAMPLFDRVIAYDPYMDADAAHSLGVEVIDDMDTLMSESDILSVHVPLTKATHHLVSAEKIALMKQGAYLINCARGPLVDNDALNDALERGHLAGAAVDVVEPEPSPTHHPLYDQPRCVVTPHVAWYSSSAIRTMRIEAAQSALNVLEGRPPLARVN